jgi:hypothetical protein
LQFAAVLVDRRWPVIHRDSAGRQPQVQFQRRQVLGSLSGDRGLPVLPIGGRLVAKLDVVAGDLVTAVT